MDEKRETIREVAASFADRAGFERAVEALIAAGFDRTDLSVLASHDSLAVAGPIAGYTTDDTKAVEAGLFEDWGVFESIAVLGGLMLVTGPVGAAVGAIVATGAGVVALRPLFAQLTQSAHAEGFAAAVEAGRIMLWVRTEDPGRLELASRLLAEAGGTEITRLERPGREPPAL